MINKLFCVLIALMICPASVWGQEITQWTFNYTGDVQTFTAPVTGYYTLECYGAQGGNSSGGQGGKGGLSQLTYHLTQGDVLYIYVGGQGGSVTEQTNHPEGGDGGWNGGGKGGTGIKRSGSGTTNKLYSGGGGGGGATHIATSDIGAITSSTNFTDNHANLLLIAGGGGGGCHYGEGGSGGGATGGVGSNNYSSWSIDWNNGTYSCGKDGMTSTNAAWSAEGCGGGGAGYQGGNTWTVTENAQRQCYSGAGGSSWGDTTNGMGYTTTAGGATEGGNGKAKITLLFQGSGTSSAPYLIPSEAVWNILADQVNAGNNYSGKYFRLTNDISVTTMVGNSESNSFQGTFDGDGHTLTISYNNNSDYTAPFRYIQGATFKNLKVTGDITTTMNLAAGIAGLNTGSTATFERCVTDVTINSTSSTVVGWGRVDYHGGFLARSNNANVNITDCVCGGSVNGSSSNQSTGAGFVGLAENYTVIGTRCLSTTSYTNLSSWSSLCHSAGAERSVSVFYYVNGNDGYGNAGTQVTTSQLADGTIFTALQAGRAEAVWVQDPITNQPMLKLFANDGKLPGEFSVNPTKQVRFSQGNLQYQASTNRWRIAEHQYDYVGGDNTYISDSYSGWIDLFGWGTSGNSASGTAYQPWSNSTTGTQYGPSISSGEWIAENSDWGVVNANQLGSGWCVLTNAEWGYLFNTRTTTATINATPNARYTQASINTDGASVGGIILFPDNFDGTASYSGVTWGTINAPSYGSTTCTTAGWSALEEAGCVFLPATGYRDGSGMAFVGTNCHYWSSTAKEATNAYNLDVDFNVSNSVVNPQQNYSRHYGFCVRLVYETPFLGSGTEADPYLISSEADWNLLADKVSTGYTYSGKFFRQTADISVTTMVGNSDSRHFSGIYDGGGYTISVNLTNNTSEATAPFRYIRGATIKNLHTTGSINSNRMYAGGIVGRAICDNTIINCSSDVFITSTCNGDGTDAGLVGAIWGVGPNTRTTLTGCVFTGKLLGSSTDHCGGLVGWCATNLGASLTIENCLYAPQERTIGTDGSKTFTRGGDFSKITITNSYYTETFGDAQGKQARSITAGDDVTISILGNGTEYNVSGITAYAHGIKYGSTYYAGSGDAVSLTLNHADAAEGYSFGGYTASSGTLSGSSNPYTLTMASSDATINAKWLKILTSANITIESVVYDGDSHTAVVKCGNETLTKGDDYTVTGTDALTNVGSTTFTITGIGGYTGTVTDLTFTIYRNFAFANSDWRTWYGAEDLTVNVNDMETYVVTEVTSDAITVASTNGEIYLNKPMLLKRKDSNTTDVHGYAPAAALTPPTTSDAYIGGVSTFASYTAGTVYVLAGSEFVRTKVTASTGFDPSKCFIYLTASAGSRLCIVSGGDTTDIQTIDDATERIWYTLDGRKLDTRPQRAGLYICNGKKVIIK